MVATCSYVQAISDLLGQLVTSSIRLPTLLQDANNLFQILSNNWEQAVRTHSGISLMDRLVATCLQICDN